MKKYTAERLRKFHRFYMPQFDLLGNHYLGSVYSPTEARVLYEIYEQDGRTAAEIVKTLNIDKSYLSRIIREHEQKGNLYRQVLETDRRAYTLHLTEAGRKENMELIQRANEQAMERLSKLTDSECKKLCDAMETITTILEGAK